MSPTYSAFWSGFGARCLRFQRLVSSLGFGTTARLGPGKTTDDETTGLQTTDCGIWKSEIGGQRSEEILLNNPPFLETPSACLKTAQQISPTNGVQTILILGEGVLMVFLGVDLWPVGVLQQNQKTEVRGQVVSPKTGVTCCKQGANGSSDRFCPPIWGEREKRDGS